MEEGTEEPEAAVGDTAAAEATAGLDPVFTPAFHSCLTSWTERREAFELHTHPIAEPTDQPDDVYVEALRLKQQLEDLGGVLAMTEEIEAVKPSLREALGVIKQRLCEGTADPGDVGVLPLLLPFDCLRADAPLLTCIYECMHSAAERGIIDPQACYSLVAESLGPQRAPLVNALDDLLARHTNSDGAPYQPPSLLPYASLALSRLEVLARRVREEAVGGHGQGRDHRVAAVIDAALHYAAQVQERLSAVPRGQGMEAWAEDRHEWEALLHTAMHTAMEHPTLPSRVPLRPLLTALSDPKAASLYLSCPYLHKCAMLRLTQAIAQSPSCVEARPLLALSLCLSRTLLQLRRESIRIQKIQKIPTTNPPPPSSPYTAASNETQYNILSAADHAVGQGQLKAEEEGLLPGVYYVFHPYGSPTSRLLSTLLPVLEHPPPPAVLDTAAQVAGGVCGVSAEGLVPLLLWQMAPHVLDPLYHWLGQAAGAAGSDDVRLLLSLCQWVLGGAQTREAEDSDSDDDQSDEGMDTAAPLLPLLPLLLPGRAGAPQAALTLLQQALSCRESGAQAGLVPVLVALLGGAAERQLLPWTALADVVMAQEGEAQWWLWLVMHDLCMRQGVDVDVGVDGEEGGMGLRTLAQRWDSQGGMLGTSTQGMDAE